MNQLLRRAASLILALCVCVIPSRALTVQQAISLLENRYIDDLPAAAYQAQTMDELLQAIGDPYTVYLSGEEYEAFLATFNDTETIGIGVSIQAHDRGVLISSVLEDTPAEESGLVAGDVILTADGVPLTDINQAASLLTGEVGTKVTLTILRENGSVQELSLTRRAFYVNTTATFSLSPDGNAGVIRCTGFGDRTSNHVFYAVRDNDDQVSTWIMDVRNNPGGNVSTSAGSAGVFVGGATMVYFRDGLDNYNYTFTHPNLKPKTEKNTIVLTNEFSASGAELFTAAIRDHGAGIAVGQRTYGKGVAQIVLTEDQHPDLFENDALKVTAYRFFSPAGTTHDQGGVLPTLLISPLNTSAAALLLSGPEPETAHNCLNISLAGFEYFISLDTALSPQYRAAFVELLEALPLTARFWMDKGNGSFGEISLDEVVSRTGVESEFTSRRFPDLADCGERDAIDTLGIYGLVSGYGDGLFRPDAPITRAEFCAMVANALGLHASQNTTQVFYDVSPDTWYYDCVTALYERGYISGYSDGGFYPSQRIKTEEIVSILAKAAAWMNMHAYDLQQAGPDADDLAAFPQFSKWAQGSAWLLDSMDVDLSDLAPGAYADRAQAAGLIYDLLTVTNVIWPTTVEE